MIYAPSVSGSSVIAVNVLDGSQRRFDTQAMIVSASNAGEEICIQTKDGKILLWNPVSGNLRRVAG